jgi:hypothetical protein
MESQPLKQWTISLPWRGWFHEPGSFIRLQHTRDTLDIMSEVIESTYDVLNGRVTLRVCHNRGLGDTPAIVCNDTPTLPTRYASDAGYGSGSAATWNDSWSEPVKRWVRANVAFWQNDNSLASVTDTRSYLAGAHV